MSKNEITGDTQATKPTTPDYRRGFDLIWGKKDSSCETCQLTVEEKAGTYGCELCAGKGAGRVE